MVAGSFVKRDGRLCSVDLKRAASLVSVTFERVLTRISDRGLRLPPAAPASLNDTVNTLASQNLARAWTLGDPGQVRTA